MSRRDEWWVSVELRTTLPKVGVETWVLQWTFQCHWKTLVWE